MNKKRQRISDIIGCNLKQDCQILIFFGTNIPDTTYWPSNDRSTSPALLAKNRTSEIMSWNEQKTTVNFIFFLDLHN